MKRIGCAALLLIAGCSQAGEQDKLGNAANTEQAKSEPLNPPAPGEPGGLPDDRTPVAEGQIDPKSPQGAGQVLQSYFALIEAGKYADAYRLWSDGGQATGESPDEFAKSFEAYREFHANIGAPGEPGGAAGSIYVDIPVQLYGRTADGKPFNARGTITLRRVNDVPGSTAEQREWRIYKSDFAQQTEADAQ